jgi:hypothetical protein
MLSRYRLSQVKFVNAKNLVHRSFSAFGEEGDSPG